MRDSPCPSFKKNAQRRPSIRGEDVIKGGPTDDYPPSIIREVGGIVLREKTVFIIMITINDNNNNDDDDDDRNSNSNSIIVI